MTIIVEDGSAVASGANAYVDVAALVAFAAARGITLPPDELDQERLLLKATDYLETQNYIGQKASYEQPLQWPRIGAQLDGYTIPSNSIPTRLKNAQLQLAVDAMTVELVPAASVPAELGAVIEKTVEGAVSVKYAEPVATGSAPSLPAAEALLGPLLRSLWGSVPARRG